VASKEELTMSFVSISKPVRDRIVQAARETPTEIIGFLLGSLQDDTIIIEDSTTHEFSSEPHRVMLPPTSIAIIADQLLSGRLKGNIVGWYHSHTEGGLFYSETDIATQKRLQQFSSLVTGVVVDSSTGEVGYFRVVPGTDQAVRIPESNINVFTNADEAVPEQRPAPLPATPTVEVRMRRPRAEALTRRTALSIILLALIVSAAAFAAVIYKYGASTNESAVMILHTPVSTATVGTPVEILTNVTGPGRNVTLVYGQTSGGPLTQAIMSSITTGEYSYLIPANQVTGNIAYYIKAYGPTGRQVNTTVYHIAVSDFGLQPEANALTVYRTKTATLLLQLQSVNNFNKQVELSTSGNPSGLRFSFSNNPATAGTGVTINVAADAAVPNGTYPVTLVGTYSAAQASQVTRQSVIDVTVADFEVAVAPPSAVVHPGATAVLTVTLTLQKGFVDSVTITDISGLPQGATYTVTASNPTILAGGPATTEVTLQIKTLAFTKAGTYPIVIVFSGGGVIHTLSAQIIVK
jgi:proteasome lid subunit RPN8/RPN11